METNEGKLNKELAQKLMKIEGESRGMNLKIDWDYILLKKGQGGLERLEAKMAELGFPIKHKDIKPMDFYPIGLDAISVLAIKELFNFTDKDIEEMGASSVNFSLLMKIFMKYFVSLELIAEELPKMWSEHYTIGDFTMPVIKREEKYVIVQLRNFKVHPIFCTVYKGYFTKVTRMVVRSPATCTETKCSFKRDKYHEFLIKW